MIGLTPYEMSLIRQDWRQMIQAPEACSVTLRWQTYSQPTGTPVPDQVYKFDTRILDPTEQELSDVRCIIKIVHARDLKILEFGIVEVGDAIFFFEDTINLKEPITGKPVAEDTLYFIDPISGKWMPNIRQAGPLRRHLGMIIGNEAIAEVVPARLKK